MTWIKLKDKFKFVSPRWNTALITIGKIILALGAISGVLGGLIGIAQGLFALYQGVINSTFFIIVILLGALRIVVGYGYYLLLDMNKSGLLVSIVKAIAEISAALSIVLSPFVILIGLIMLLQNPLFGLLLALWGGIMFCAGLGLMSFLEERDRFQIAKQAPESTIGQENIG